MSHQTTVAVIGLGAMGHAFAANLVKKGFPTHIWNRTRARGDSLAAAGAIQCDTPAEAARQADVVITMLPDGTSTDAVIYGDDGVLGSLRQHGIIAQMGTLGIDATRSLIDGIKRSRPDVVFIDAPVSGTKAPAENAQVVVLASGDRQAAAAIEPVFAAIAKSAKWLGEAGAGSRMKLIVNAWLIAMMEGIAETAQLAKALGFTPDDLWGVLEGGPLAAPYIKGKLAMIANDDYDAQMALEWGLKDARLALKAADTRNLPGLKRISEIWQDAVDDGLGKSDIAVVYRYLG